MLGKHCSSCGFPIFEKDGLEYCPNCNGLKIEIKNYSKDLKEEIKEMSENSKNEDKLQIIDRKIEYLFLKLDSEEEIGRINEITSSIKTLFKIKKYL